MKLQTTHSPCSLIHVVHSFGVAFGNLSPFGRLCPLIHCVHSSGFAFGNLSPFGRVWLNLLNSGLNANNRSRLESSVLPFSLGLV